LRQAALRGWRGGTAGAGRGRWFGRSLGVNDYYTTLF